jgi:hypothetical protein
MDALARAEARDPQVPGDIRYWYEYRLKAERDLQALGIHLAAPTGVNREFNKDSHVSTSPVRRSRPDQ